MKNKYLLLLFISLFIFGCHNQTKTNKNENEFFTEISNTIDDILGKDILQDTHFKKVSVNSEFTERDNGKNIKVLSIVYSSFNNTQIETLSYDQIVNDLRMQIDLEYLRKNYDLIELILLKKESEEDIKTLYYYINFTSSFAIGENSLTGQKIENTK